MKKILLGRLAVGVICAGLLVSCATTPKAKPEGMMDTPEHHAALGDKLLALGQVDDAAKEYDRALALDSRFIPAIAGNGVVLAYRKDEKGSLAALERAMDLAKKKPDKALTHTGFVRAYTQLRTEKWLKRAEDHFEDAIDEDESYTPAYYHMGQAYRESLDFRKAVQNFRRVIALNKELVEESDQAWEEIQKVERAGPGTKAGKEIAPKPQVSRADVAALLVEEMNLPALFQEFGAPPLPPAGSTKVPFTPPTDYSNHPMKKNIDQVIAINLRGLEPVEGAFEPDMPVTRAQFAIILEDILMRITREEQLATKFISNASPFKDVPSDDFAFNAIIVSTSRGLLESDLMGKFRKDAPVSGADALLALRKIREKIRRR